MAAFDDQYYAFTLGELCVQLGRILGKSCIYDYHNKKIIVAPFPTVTKLEGSAKNEYKERSGRTAYFIGATRFSEYREKLLFAVKVPDKEDGHYFIVEELFVCLPKQEYDLFKEEIAELLDIMSHDSIVHLFETRSRLGLSNAKYEQWTNVAQNPDSICPPVKTANAKIEYNDPDVN